MARRNLLASIENGGINEINETIQKCLKEKIIDTDSDIENANRKLAVLLLRKGNYQYCEWVLFNPNFSVISWREQVSFQWDDDEVHFAQDQHAELDFYSASSLKQQSAGRHVVPLGHIILIPSRPVFALSL